LNANKKILWVKINFIIHRYNYLDNVILCNVVIRGNVTMLVSTLFVT